MGKMTKMGTFFERLRSWAASNHDQSRHLLILSPLHVQYTQSEWIRLRHLTIRLDSQVTSQLDSHGVASRKSTSGMTNRQQGKRFVSIPSNRRVTKTFSPHPQSPDQLYFLSLAQTTSGMSNQQKGKRFVSIR